MPPPDDCEKLGVAVRAAPTGVLPDRWPLSMPIPSLARSATLRYGPPMRISIALASYNGARFIREQLESFSAQTRLPDELVVCDDGSSDSTLEIVQAFAREARFDVRIERNPQNLGLNANFGRAMALTTGDIVLISDQDDIWYPDKIAVVEQALLAQPSKLALIHDEHLVDAQGKRLAGSFLGRVRQVGYGDRYFVAGNCTAQRRSLLSLILPFPPQVNYDSWIALLTDLLETRMVIERPLQSYRRHGGNVTEPELAIESPNRWLIAARFGLRDPRTAWATEAALLQEAIGRLISCRDALDAAAGTLIGQAAVLRARGEKERLERRLALLGIPRWRRGPAVARLWATGFYRDLSGTKSAIKDALRP